MVLDGIDCSTGLLSLNSVSLVCERTGSRCPRSFDSFEKGTTVPDGWQKGPAVSGVKYIYEVASGSEGKRSLCLEKSANRYFPIASWSRRFEYQSEKKFLNVTAKIKARKVTKAIIEIQFGNMKGEFYIEGMVGLHWSERSTE